MDEPRDFYAEALAIIEGTTRLLPEREHLVALAAEHKKDIAFAFEEGCNATAATAVESIRGMFGKTTSADFNRS